MATFIIALVALAGGFAWGSLHRERRNQAEWRDYQAFLRQRRARPRFGADRWGVSSGPPVVSPE